MSAFEAGIFQYRKKHTRANNLRLVPWQSTCVAGTQTHKRATHVLPVPSPQPQPAGARLPRAQGTGRRAAVSRGRGHTCAPEACRVDRGPLVHPLPTVRLTSPGRRGPRPRAEPPGPRRCDHGGAPPYTEAPCSARRRPAAPPPAVPPCLYPSPSAFIASACMPTAHLHPRRALINTGAKQQGQAITYMHRQLAGISSCGS